MGFSVVTLPSERKDVSSDKTDFIHLLACLIALSESRGMICSISLQVVITVSTPELL